MTETKEFQFELTVNLTVEAEIKEGEKMSPRVNMKELSTQLAGSEGIDHSQYFTPEGVMTKAGAQIVHTMLVHSMVANMKYESESGYVDLTQRIAQTMQEIAKMTNNPSIRISKNKD